jgi:hypothetical protein
MTAITAKLSNRRASAVAERVRRLGGVAGSFLVAIGSRWNDLVDGGQLGPNADTVISRHTGARI